MSMRNEEKKILDHALENEKNLKIALDINSAFEGNLNKKIIKDFLNKLKDFVLDKLGDPDMSQWALTNSYSLFNSPLKSEQMFGFKKKEWEDQEWKDQNDKNDKYSVVLVPGSDDACGFEICVFKHRDAPRVMPEGYLWKTLNKRFGESEKPTAWWEWHRPLHDRYRNWGTKDGLLRLRFHEDEAVKHIGQDLVNIIEVAAPIIDEHVKNPGKRS